ncbi:DUF2262 domain-containing protein [Pedobacter sp. AW31-3R]|uniref:DUF2262 domain-containing protein n=1 Tax=Pedobacter sp. AW31-3R TaxID=3445781 RepID=UPI003F9F103E
MKETWNYKLMDLLQNARHGNAEELNGLMTTNRPFVIANEDFSVLLVLRHFNVHFWNEERRVTNSHPEGEHFQCGLTLVRCADDGCAESNIYLPNKLNYQELKINGQEIEIVFDEERITTNVTELFRKLKFFKLSITEREVEEGFSKLCNEKYAAPKETTVKSKNIELPSFGMLTYDEKLKWYKKQLKIDDDSIELTIDHTTARGIEKLIAFADRQLKSRFYIPLLLEMEEKMIALKNDIWLSADEDTGEEEALITAEEFRKRVSISSIAFHQDGSCSIYCDDDDIFFGHSIQISVNKTGRYEDANLAG